MKFFPSAGMVGKQGVAAPVSCRFWISGTAVLYMSACASLCKRQPTIIICRASKYNDGAV
jgi:hypothetical protein